MKTQRRESPFVYLMRVSSRGGWLLGLTILLAAVSGVLTVLPFYALYRLIEELMTGGATTQELTYWGVYILVSSVAQLVFFMLSMVASHITAFRILRDLRYAVARKLLELPLGWFTRRTSGDTRKLFTEDIEKIELFIAHHIPDLTRAIVTPLATLAFLFTADWRLALVSLIPAALSPLFLITMYRNYDENMGAYYELLGRMNGTIIEYIRGMSVVRAFNRTAESFGDYRRSVDTYFRFWKDWTVRIMSHYGGFLTIIESGVFFILVIGGPLYLADVISLPSLIITLILGPAYVASLKTLMFFSSLMSMNLRGVTRLREVLESDPLREPVAPRLPAGDEISFSDISFAYDEEPVLKGISFTAAPGTITALVGPSGAGKSTAAMLAARFYDPESGVIRIGGTAYPDVGTRELMDRVSICFQEAQLFKGTIEDNIRMGDRGAGTRAVVAAARAARADEFIARLPLGYKTRVAGDRMLSGGQIQRIAIARAILKGSPIVVLDEATSYADPENERLIQEALNELLRDRTVLVVAHRIKTLRHVDQILVFDEGRIVEAGTWDELAAIGGTFTRLLRSAEAALSWSVRPTDTRNEVVSHAAH